MNSRRTTTCFFAVLLLANYLHCAAHAAFELRWLADYRGCIVSNESTPLNLPPPVCDHEFGCICRGAVVAQVVNAEALRPGLNSLELIDAPDIIGALDVWQDCQGTQFSQNLFSDAHPLTALEVRARLASFLI